MPSPAVEPDDGGGDDLDLDVDVADDGEVEDLDEDEDMVYVDEDDDVLLFGESGSSYDMASATPSDLCPSVRSFASGDQDWDSRPRSPHSVADADESTVDQLKDLYDRLMLAQIARSTSPAPSAASTAAGTTELVDLVPPTPSSAFLSGRHSPVQTEGGDGTRTPKRFEDLAQDRRDELSVFRHAWLEELGAVKVSELSVDQLLDDIDANNVEKLMDAGFNLAEFQAHQAKRWKELAEGSARGVGTTKGHFSHFYHQDEPGTNPYWDKEQHAAPDEDGLAWADPDPTNAGDDVQTWRETGPSTAWRHGPCIMSQAPKPAEFMIAKDGLNWLPTSCPHRLWAFAPGISIPTQPRVVDLARAQPTADGPVPQLSLRSQLDAAKSKMAAELSKIVEIWQGADDEPWGSEGQQSKGERITGCASRLLFTLWLIARSTGCTSGRLVVHVAADDIDSKWFSLVAALRSPDGVLRTQSAVHTLTCARLKSGLSEPSWVVTAHVSNAFSAANAELLPRLVLDRLATSPHALIPDVYDLLDVDEDRSLYVGQGVVGDRGLPVFEDTVLPTELTMAGIGHSWACHPKAKVDGLDDGAFTLAQDPAVIDLDWLVDPADKAPTGSQAVVVGEQAEEGGQPEEKADLSGDEMTS